MNSKTITQYTLRQRRLREQLNKARSLDDLKAFLDETVVGSPAIVSDFRERTLDERKVVVRGQVETELQRQYDGGFAYDFAAHTATNEATLPGGTTEAAGVRTIQMRGPFDRSQWSAVAQAAKAEIDTGNPGAAMRPIRTADNARVTVTAQEAYDAMMALQSWGGAKLEHSWDLKDQIDNATSHADLDAIDVTAGWPG